MDEALDLKVAQALMRLRLVERALHDHGDWSMRYAGTTVGASRFIRDDRISFVAHFPPLCLIGEAPTSIDLFSGDELVRTIDLTAPLDEDGCEVWWDLMLSEHVGV